MPASFAVNRRTAPLSGAERSVGQGERSAVRVIVVPVVLGAALVLGRVVTAALARSDVSCGH